MSETGSQVSWDDFSDSRCVSPALSCDFDINDTSWVDTPTLGSEVTSPEPPPTSSIWARFGSGIQRFTQDLGKTASAATASIPSIHMSGDASASAVGLPRDNVIEGAESEAKPNATESGSWSLPESFLKLSLGRRSSSYNTRDEVVTDWIGSQRFMRSHSSNMLDDDSVSADVDSAAVSGPTKTVLNHSPNGPFTPVHSQSLDPPLVGSSDPPGAGSSDPLGAGSSEVQVAGSDGSVMSSLHLASPARLMSKPPLPQRSGTLSPRDVSSRPRLTHRRSQSLQFTTASAGSFTPAVDRSTTTVTSSGRVQGESTADPATLGDDHTTRSDVSHSSTHEIFV